MPTRLEWVTILSTTGKSMLFKPKDYKNTETLTDDDFICFCLKVSKGTIKKAVQDGAKNLKEIREITKACTGSDCKTLNPTKKCCSPQIMQIIREYQ